MRLGSKIFLTSALVIVVLAGVGVLSLLAVDRLVSVNQEIATRTVPALRLTASAREGIAPLMRTPPRANPDRPPGAAAGRGRRWYRPGGRARW